MTAVTTQFTPRLCTDKVATILSGQTDSDIVDLKGTTLIGFEVPASFTGGSITFKVGKDASSLKTFRNTAGTVATVTITPDSSYGLVATDFAAWRFIQLIAGSAQAGDVALNLQTRPLG